jgi:hypothetical protein
MKPRDPLDRRQFLRSGTRYALLAGLGGLIVTGEAKRRRLGDDPNCIRVWTCADCVEFGGCTKSKAEDFRQAKTKRLE